MQSYLNSSLLAYPITLVSMFMYVHILLFIVEKIQNELLRVFLLLIVYLAYAVCILFLFLWAIFGTSVILGDAPLKSDSELRFWLSFIAITITFMGSFLAARARHKVRLKAAGIFYP